MTTYKTVRFSEIDHAQIKAFCDERNWSVAGFLKVAAAGEMNRVVDEENEERDMRQGLDNLVEDPNCDYRLIVRNGNTVSIQNKHTNVVSHFESDALAADHILGEESQARPPVVDDANPTDEEVESYNTWVLVQIAEVQSQHRLTDEQNEALAYARQFIGGDD